ncbi:MAG: AtpZ/AtpI family protein [Defluviitaleaceae bacterium]|nr:AtpZ/AtpI family protein [Defluviitaleaceae bacterium]
MKNLTKEEKAKIRKASTLMFSVSINMIVCIGLSVFIGVLLDRWINTSPLFVILFIIIGIAAAFKNMYRMCMNVIKE